jgi:hypothetical protein
VLRHQAHVHALPPPPDLQLAQRLLLLQQRAAGGGPRRLPLQRQRQLLQLLLLLPAQRAVRGLQRSSAASAYFPVRSCSLNAGRGLTWRFSSKALSSCCSAIACSSCSVLQRRQCSRFVKPGRSSACGEQEQGGVRGVSARCAAGVVRAAAK